MNENNATDSAGGDPQTTPIQPAQDDKKQNHLVETSSQHSEQLVTSDKGKINFASSTLNFV